MRVILCVSATERVVAFCNQHGPCEQFIKER
jgi:hypothetical protein